MKSKTKAAILTFVIIAMAYLCFAVFIVIRTPPGALIYYAINPHDFLRDKFIYVPELGRLLVWRISGLGEADIREIVEDPTMTPYVILSLAYSHPERVGDKFKRAVQVLEILRERGLSLYKLDSGNCSSLFLAAHALENDVAHMNNVTRDGHRRIVEYLNRVGDRPKFVTVNARCVLKEPVE